MEFTKEIVINVEFGGFSVSREMAEWLRDEKGWTTTEDENEIDKDNFDFVMSKHWFHPNKYDRDSVEFRSNPDLVECVKFFHKKYEDECFIGKGKPQVMCLRVIEATVHLDVEHVYDGKEGISCWSSEEDVTDEDD
jgi:hypothetical protein